MQHSPGPWRVDASSPEEVLDCRSQMVADVFGSSTENPANASLIAAAPELLDACIKALKAGQDPKRAERGGDCYPLPNILREAIAKAGYTL